MKRSAFSGLRSLFLVVFVYATTNKIVILWLLALILLFISERGTSLKFLLKKYNYSICPLGVTNRTRSAIGSHMLRFVFKLFGYYLTFKASLSRSLNVFAKLEAFSSVILVPEC